MEDQAICSLFGDVETAKPGLRPACFPMDATGQKVLSATAAKSTSEET
jgi:hypothetical protein